MGKPTKEELIHALAIAGHLRDHGRDRHHLGHSLLYLQARNAQLEGVLQATLQYLRSGQDQQAHARLVRAVERARDEPENRTEAGPVRLASLGL